MTEQEAIEVLKMENELMQFDPITGDDNPIEFQNQDNKDLYEANLLAIEAIEKQMNDRWIPFVSEYDKYYEMEMLQGKLPEENEEILVTDGVDVWSDTFVRDGIECYLDGGREFVDDVIAWRPLPEPYKGE